MVQEDHQLQANRKVRAVQTPGREGHAEQEPNNRMAGDEGTQPPGNGYVGLSPSSRMAALRLRE